MVGGVGAQNARKDRQTSRWREADREDEGVCGCRGKTLERNEGAVGRQYDVREKDRATYTPKKGNPKNKLYMRAPSVPSLFLFA